jgi:hypothetical protein
MDFIGLSFMGGNPNFIPAQAPTIEPDTADPAPPRHLSDRQAAERIAIDAAGD